MLRVPALAALLCSTLAVPTVAFAQGAADAGDTAADEQAVLGVIERLFDGMRAADAGMVRSTFHPEARLMTATTAEDGRPVVRESAIDGFAESVGRAQVELDERIFDVEVRVNGNLASAWTPYAFYAGGEFSHCGVNAFQLARTDDGWKILQITDTRQREGCGRAERAGADAARPQGHLYIVGGGTRGPELWTRFIELAGGQGQARILIIPLASSQPERSGESLAEAYRERGAAATRSLVLTREQAMDPATARILDDYDGIWFVGGSQSRITDVLAGSPFNEAIRRRYDEGAVIGGTSAGAAIMSDSMITGSQILEDEDTIGYHGDTFTRIERGYLEIVPGLGYLPGAIVDQHFLQRERHNRLISVVLDRPGMLGVGIDESTAVVVNPDGTWDVIGESSAVIYDARDARITPPGAPILGAGGMRMHVVPAGARFDPATGEVRLPGRTAASAGAAGTTDAADAAATTDAIAVSGDDGPAGRPGGSR